MPGYTHLQRAQPVLFGHHMMAYFSMLERDFDRLLMVFKHADIMPLGAGALAGSTYGIDQTYTQELLGFSLVFTKTVWMPYPTVTMLWNSYPLHPCDDAFESPQ